MSKADFVAAFLAAQEAMKDDARDRKKRADDVAAAYARENITRRLRRERNSRTK